MSARKGFCDLKLWLPGSQITPTTTNHLKQITAVNPSGTYTYAGQKLTLIRDRSIPTDLFYDDWYRLSGVTGPSGHIDYNYNAADQLTGYMVQTGPSAGYTYYPDGSLRTITWSPISGQFRYNYDLDGRYSTIMFPNGQHRDFSFDDQGRLLSIGNIHPAGNLAAYSYSYDLGNATNQNGMLGQITGMTATVPAAGMNNSTWKYYYDRRYQLTQVNYPQEAPFSGEVDSWTYDAIGNRLTNTVNGVTQNYTYFKYNSNPNNSDRLSSDGVNSYTYNENGAMLTKTGPDGTYNFTYDLIHRMKGISGAITASYVNDVYGTRHSKTVGGVKTNYLYSGPFAGADMIRETGPATVDYLYGPGIDQPLAMYRANTLYYYDTDGLGSITALNDANGNVVNTYAYDAWGVVKAQSGTVANSFTYTARETGEAGLMYYRARYMNPATGRFASEDPLRFAAGVNFHSYVLNNPVNSVDPSGLAVGHHYVPRAIFTKITISAEAYRVFDKTTTGGPIPGGHFNHPSYTAGVKAEFDLWLKQRKINPANMTAKQAEEFLQLVRSSKNPVIRNFLRGIDKQFGRRVCLLKKAGRLPWLAIAFFLWDWHEDGFMDALDEADGWDFPDDGPTYMKVYR